MSRDLTASELYTLLAAQQAPAFQAAFAPLCQSAPAAVPAAHPLPMRYPAPPPELPLHQPVPQHPVSLHALVEPASSTSSTFSSLGEPLSAMSLFPPSAFPEALSVPPSAFSAAFPPYYASLDAYAFAPPGDAPLLPQFPVSATADVWPLSAIPPLPTHAPTVPCSSRARQDAARTRTTLACDRCRMRKAKCSGESPTCRRCTAKGFACHYTPAEPRHRRRHSFTGVDAEAVAAPPAPVSAVDHARRASLPSAPACFGAGAGRPGSGLSASSASSEEPLPAPDYAEAFTRAYAARRGSWAPAYADAYGTYAPAARARRKPAPPRLDLGALSNFASAGVSPLAAHLVQVALASSPGPVPLGWASMEI